MNTYDKLREAEDDPRKNSEAEDPNATELDEKPLRTPELILAEAYDAVKRRHFANAALLFEEAFDKEKPKVETLCDYGVCLNRIGQIDQAEKIFRDIIKTTRAVALPYICLGVLLARDRGLLDEAEQMFMLALEIDPKCPAKGNLLALQRQREIGRIVPEEDIRVFPELEKEAYMWEEKGKFAQALKIYQDFLHVYPRSANSLTRAAELLMKMNRTREAENHLEKAVRVKPSYGRAWRQYGKAMVMKGDYDAAKTAFERAIECNPRDGSARRRLARLINRETQPDDTQIRPPTAEERFSEVFPIPRISLASGDGFQIPGHVECTQCRERFSVFGVFDPNNPATKGVRCRSCSDFICQDCLKKKQRTEPIIECSCGASRTTTNGPGNFEEMEVYRKGG